ncbi:NAD-dependent succinate-semialdehyde dehydrogenase [Corynebacterium bovis]|uniref:NAD-dependent succinate-semialdehyde dehydrogenase n=1 Tax=Corynebacterium bovis TaxID=36808 RepID=UPI00244BEA39|nr:NAD-dependent succinate-semialdehyde dehydrogenase [Corynebacterium bovis]MDH2456219.1 NAD-dependent succinate-semialdehyde dehydrogenase [Corynebacterium bovis]
MTTFTTTLTAADRTITVPTGLFLGGSFRAGSDGETFTVTDPATARPLVDVASATEADAREALDVACDVAADWAATPARDRAEILRRLFESVTAHGDDLTVLQSLEMGRALPDSRSEVAYGAEFFRWFSERAASVRGDYRHAPSGSGRIITHHRPVGPVLAITPWNFPLAMATRKIAPALAAGCPIILKPAQLTPLTMLYLADLAREAGVPDGVLQVLPTHEARRVSSLLGDPRLRKLTFTGSTAVGQALAKTAAETTVRTSLELGGNAPFIVLSHADVTAAAEAAVASKMRNGGEVCIASNRFIVHEALAPAFTRAVTERMAGYVMGPGTDPATTLGPMVSAEQRDGIADLVDTALDEGATAVLGGKRVTTAEGAVDPAGFYYPATVLTGVEPDSTIANTEIFGPVLPVQTVASDEEAVRVANDTPFGLAAYVFGERFPETLDVAESVQAGMVGVNRGVISDAAAPFGGVKQSGIGREGGFEGIDEYLETVYLAL